MSAPEPDPEVPRADQADQAEPMTTGGRPLDWNDVDRELDELPPETPQADAVDQMRPVNEPAGPVAPLVGSAPAPSRTDPEVPEADALEQAMPVAGPDDDDDRRSGPIDDADRW